MKFLRRISLIFAVFFLLSGCAPSGEGQIAPALDFRTRLLSASGCSFTAEITADYGDRQYTFSTDCRGDQDGNLTFTVTAPDTIAGIAGRVEAEGGKLTFDDTALDFGILADGQVSPVTCTYMMLKTWRGGYISAVGETEDGLRITFDSSFEEKPLTVDLWLDQGGLPQYGEITFSGRRILSAEIGSFTFLSGKETD